jgi:hypothetical protein
MGLFLYQGVGLDPYYLHSRFRMRRLVVDPLDCSELPTAATLNEASTCDWTVIQTVSLRGEHTAASQLEPQVVAPEDSHSRHYADDQWFETEAEKQAQDRRQGKRFSYTELGMRRQSIHDTGVTAEQMQELLKQGGTPGQDQ